MGGITILPICPLISVQCLPFTESMKETASKGAWEMIPASTATCRKGQSGEGQTVITELQSGLPQDKLSRGSKSDFTGVF